MEDFISGTAILQEIRAVRDELREFRETVTAWQLETAERIARAETTLHPIVGNGQPGKLATMDTRITSLERTKWKWAGIASGSGLVAGFIFDLLKKKWFGF